MSLFKLKAYLRFLKESTNQYGVHSPFVYSFIIKCLYDRKKKTTYPQLKLAYKRHKKTADTRLKKLKLFHRIVSYFKSEQVYIFATYPSLWEIAASAENDFAQVHPVSQWKDYHPFLSDSKKLVFIEQKIWRKEMEVSTLVNFLDQLHPKDILILEGVHENEKSEDLWNQVKQYPKTTVSIDLFFWGLVFFKEDQAPQHFNIRF